MKVLVKMVHGSHMYGLDTPNSDKDFKGVYLPDPLEVLAGYEPKVVDTSTGDSKSKNTSEDVDCQMYPLSKFLKMLSVGDMVALDMLHALPEHLLETSPQWAWLQENKHMFYTRNMAGLLGYVRQQAHRYGLRGSRVASLESVNDYLVALDPDAWLEDTNYQSALKGLAHVSVKEEGWLSVLGKRFYGRTKVGNVLYSVEKQLTAYGNRAKLAAKNEGVDWKAVSHALRAARQLEEMLTTGNLVFPLKDREYLLKVKQGELDFVSEVQPELERMVDLVTKLASESSLKDEVAKSDLLLTTRVAYSE